MTSNTTPIPQRQRRGLAAWSTRDLLMVAVIGLAFGVATLPMMIGYVALLGLGPIAAHATTGLYRAYPNRLR